MKISVLFDFIRIKQLVLTHCGFRTAKKNRNDARYVI